MAWPPNSTRRRKRTCTTSRRRACRRCTGSRCRTHATPTVESGRLPPIPLRRRRVGAHRLRRRLRGSASSALSAAATTSSSV